MRLNKWYKFDLDKPMKDGYYWFALKESIPFPKGFVIPGWFEKTRCSFGQPDQIEYVMKIKKPIHPECVQEMNLSFAQWMAKKYKEDVEEEKHD